MSACVNDTDGDGNCAACARNPKAPCRMSAEAELQEFLQDYARLDGAEATVAAKRFLDKHAHELAEKIRKQRHETHDHISCLPCFVYGEAATLIDPEASNNGV